jgi:hypothetical protein
MFKKSNKYCDLAKPECCGRTGIFKLKKVYRCQYYNIFCNCKYPYIQNQYEANTESILEAKKKALKVLLFQLKANLM